MLNNTDYYMKNLCKIIIDDEWGNEEAEWDEEDWE